MLRGLLKMSLAPSPKRMKPNGSTIEPLIATHNGHFHADEALAVYLLRLLPTYSPSRLLRTRDPALLSTAHTVVDVGGEYSPPNNRYDHHQRTFNTTFPSRPTKLSSAGLVYLHFGKAIVALKTGLSEDSGEVNILWKKIYEDFVEALDAHDNGISVYDPAETKSLQKRFYDGGISLGSLVGDLNDSSDDEEQLKNQTAEEAQAAEDERFLSASSLMGETFLRKLRYYHKAWLPARAQVLEAFHQRQDVHEGGQIMVFRQGCPWKDHLYTIEKETGTEGQVLYVLYPENEAEDSRWRIQAVGVSKDSFESRKGLPAPWRGVRDEDLSGLTGINGCIFVHASGFIGGNATREGAMLMAQKALES